MKTATRYLGLSFILSSAFSQAQPAVDETPREAALRNRNLVHLTEGGFYAESLEDLVASSVVIVRGRYGAVERRGVDYGLGVTREDVMARTGASEETISMYGFPYVHYEILIDEILKGNELLVDAPVLTIAMAEAPDALDIAPWLAEFREGEHLFFLYLNVDGTYQIRGDMFDMKLIGDSYLYLPRESYAPINAPVRYVPVFGSERQLDFIEVIRILGRD